MINLELKKELRDKTRRLGTRVDSYLDEFLRIYIENENIKVIDDFINFSKYKNKSDATKKQIFEVFLVFKLINIDGEFVINIQLNDNSFKDLIRENIKSSIRNINDFNSPYKNNYKLINDFIYSYGVLINEEKERDIDDFCDEELKTRTSELKTQHIDFNDNNLKILIEKEFNILIEKCGYLIDNKKNNLRENIVNEISRLDLSNEKIKELKKGVNNEVVNTLDLIDILLNEKIKVTIPFYQREYVWSEYLIQNFLNEILNNKNKILNIGNILISAKRRSGNELEYCIVDGQQRITSLILLINHIFKKININNITVIEQELLEKFKEIKPLCDNSNLVKFVENKSNPNYLNELKEILDSNSKFVNAKNALFENYNVIHAFFEKLNNDETISFLKRMLTVFSVITYDDYSNDIDLFISSNSYSKKLSNFDLIKSFLISKISENVKANDLLIINEKINKITTLIKFNQRKSDDKVSDIFFKFYLNYYDISNYELINKEKNIFKRFKETFDKNIKTEKDLELLLDSLINFLNIYRITKNIDNSDEIYLKDFKLSLGEGLKTISIYDLFLHYAIESTISMKNSEIKYKLLNIFRIILLKIEKFEIKWKLFNFSGDSLSGTLTNLFKSFYVKVNHEIEEEKIENIISEFNNSIEESNGFFKMVYEKQFGWKDFLNSQNIKKDTIALKILNRVGFNKYNNNSIEYKKNSTSYFEHEKPSIEHIFPKKHSKWLEYDANNASNLIDYIDNIGNKFILNLEENKSAGNRTFNDKMKIYEGYNNLKLDYTLKFKYGDQKEKEFDFLKMNYWSYTDIEIREKYIINELLKIWEKYK